MIFPFASTLSALFTFHVLVALPWPEGLYLKFYFLQVFKFAELKLQAAVVQTLDSAIHRIKIYPVDSAIGFPNTYPLNSDLSGG